MLSYYEVMRSEGQVETKRHMDAREESFSIHKSAEMTEPRGQLELTRGTESLSVIML
jgi:hypothetical protein